MPPKAHVWVLSLIVLVGFMRGGYWVVTTEVWSRVDEAQHYGYVEFMARGHGMPEVGKDKLQLDARGVGKASPTLGFRSAGFYTVSEDSDWGIFGNLYEGGGYQGPLYYALLVPAYWLAQPFDSTIATIYILRVATLLIMLTSIPLLWLLARELFPKLPAVWLTSPAILVAMQGFNSNTVSVTNDSLIVPISIAALVPVASAWRGINNQQAVLAGALFGLAMLCKNTASPLAVLTLIVLVGLLLARRASFRDLLVWGLIYMGTAFVVLLPYHLWNLFTYGSFSASSEINVLLKPLLQHTPLTFDGLRTHFHNVRVGYFDFSYGLGPSAYVSTFAFPMAIFLLAGLAVTLRRRFFDEASALVWAGTAYFVAFFVVLAASVSIYGEGSTIIGRHLYAGLGLFAIALAAGACLSLGSRFGVLAIVLVLGVSFINEREVTEHYVLATYADGVLYDKWAPVVDQPLNEGYTQARSISAKSACPVTAIGLAIVNPAPETLMVTSPSEQQATYIGENKSVALYQLPATEPGDFTIETPGLLVGREFADRDPTVSLAGATGDPVVRLYCVVDNPNEFRFKQMFEPGHVDVSYSLVRGWADVWYWIGWALVAVSLSAMAALAYYDVRRRYRPSGSHK